MYDYNTFMAGFASGAFVVLLVWSIALDMRNKRLKRENEQKQH